MPLTRDGRSVSGDAVGVGTILTVSLFLLLTGTARAQVSHVTVRWSSTSGDPVAAALNLTELESMFMVNRMLLEDPAGRRVILTETTEFQTGMRIAELLDQDSGWWIQIRTNLGVRAQNWKDFFNRSYDALEKEDATMRVDVRSSENVHWSGEIPIRGGWISTSLRSLGSDLVEGPVGDALGGSIPSRLQPTLEFLRQELRLGRTGENFRTILEFLAPFLPDKAPSPFQQDGSDLVREDGDFTMGLDFADPQFSELLRRFPSIDPAHPTAAR